MHAPQSQYDSSTAIRTDLGAIFVSLELSRATWLITSLSPGNGEKMWQHVVQGGRCRRIALALRHLFRRRRAAVLATSFHSMGSGFIGFSRIIGSKSYVDAASIAASRRG